MTDKNTSTTRQPSHFAYHVRDREDARGHWTRIGSAWVHTDGKGFNIRLESVPVDGRVTLRLAAEAAK